MRTPTDTIAAALEFVAREIHSEHDVANAVCMEAAQRLRELNAAAEALALHLHQLGIEMGRMALAFDRSDSRAIAARRLSAAAVEAAESAIIKVQERADLRDGGA